MPHAKNNTRRVVQVNELGRRVGETHHRARLTDAEVDLVFQLFDFGVSLRDIARMLGVSYDTAKKIHNGTRRGQAIARAKVVHVSR